MMKKTFTILIALLAMNHSINSQELEIDWGKAFDSKTEIQKILGFSGETMVAYSMKGKKRYFDFFSKKDYQYKSSTEYVLQKINNLKSGLLNTFITGDQISIMLYTYDKKAKSFTLYVQVIDMKGKLVGKPKEIYKSKGSTDKLKEMRVSMTFSPDNSKAMVYFDRKNKEKTVFSTDIVTFDLTKDLTELTNSTYNFDIRDSKSDRVSYRVTHSIESNGVFNLLSEKKEFAKGKISSFKLLVSRYNKNGGMLGEAVIKDGDKLLGSSTIVAKGGKVYVVGYYSNNPKNLARIKGYSGLFTAELSEKMELKKITTSHFSDEFMKNIFSGRKVDKKSAKGKELLVPVYYRMNDIIVHENGTLTVLSEFYQVVVVQQKGTKTTTTNYGSILFFKLNSEGEIIASDAIKKLQRSSSVSTSIGAIFGGGAIFISIEFPDKLIKYWSYALSYDDNDIFLVFNDHYKNANDGENDMSKPMTNPKKSAPYLVTISKDGSFTKKVMTGSGDTDTYLVPQVTYGTSESNFVIWGVWRKQNKFGSGTISK